jgi:hypothetical protein
VAAPALTGCASNLERRFQAHIDYLASDELEGRAVGSRGIELAAEYIADQFAQIGLEPAGENGTYFQTFEMTLHRTLTDATRLAFEGDPVERHLRKDFIPFSFSLDEAFSGDVVFCGYGIEAPDKEHDDFVHVDLSGKVALMLRGEPPSWADENGYPTRHAMLRNKVYNAKDRNAAAVVIVNQTPLEGETDELTEFTTESADEYGIPAFHITSEMAAAQLKRAALEPLAKLQERLDAGKYASAVLRGVRSSGQAVFKKKRAPTRNVVGLLRGEGPSADEVVVIGAHYDHLGIRKPMMRKFKAGKLVREKQEAQIHNGADDNASGTSGLIETARMFAEGPRPKRSAVFVAFTAEESGLHGSKHYVENPSVALENTVAMLNMDMIGRMGQGSRSVEVFGLECGKEFKPIVEKAAESVGLEVAGLADAGGRSDQASFVRKNIPSMHFFSGHHGDYHQPSDDSDKINAPAGAKIASLVYAVAYDLTTRDESPTFQEVKAAAGPAGTPTYRVVMGLAPGYGDDGKPGMAVDRVSPDGPADLAGMKTGDRVIRIAGKEVGNIYDYMAATRKNKPGDTVEVIVLRAGKEITLQVTLAPAR